MTHPREPHQATETSAHFFLEGLVEAGIEYLFCNLGTDHATLIEEFARAKAMGRKRLPSSPALMRMLPFTWRVPTQR